MVNPFDILINVLTASGHYVKLLLYALYYLFINGPKKFTVGVFYFWSAVTITFGAPLVPLAVGLVLSPVQESQELVTYLVYKVGLLYEWLLNCVVCNIINSFLDTIRPFFPLINGFINFIKLVIHNVIDIVKSEFRKKKRCEEAMRLRETRAFAGYANSTSGMPTEEDDCGQSFPILGEAVIDIADFLLYLLHLLIDFVTKIGPNFTLFIDIVTKIVDIIVADGEDLISFIQSVISNISNFTDLVSISSNIVSCFENFASCVDNAVEDYVKGLIDDALNPLKRETEQTYDNENISTSHSCEILSDNTLYDAITSSYNISKVTVNDIIPTVSTYIRCTHSSKISRLQACQIAANIMIAVAVKHAIPTPYRDYIEYSKRCKALDIWFRQRTNATIEQQSKITLGDYNNLFSHRACYYKAVNNVFKRECMSSTNDTYSETKKSYSNNNNNNNNNSEDPLPEDIWRYPRKKEQRRQSNEDNSSENRGEYSIGSFVYSATRWNTSSKRYNIPSYHAMDKISKNLDYSHYLKNINSAMEYAIRNGMYSPSRTGKDTTATEDNAISDKLKTLYTNRINARVFLYSLIDDKTLCEYFSILKKSNTSYVKSYIEDNDRFFTDKCSYRNDDVRKTKRDGQGSDNIVSCLTSLFRRNYDHSFTEFQLSKKRDIEKGILKYFTTDSKKSHELPLINNSSSSSSSNDVLTLRSTGSTANWNKKRTVYTHDESIFMVWYAKTVYKIVTPPVYYIGVPLLKGEIEEDFNVEEWLNIVLDNSLTFIYFHTNLAIRIVACGGPLALPPFWPPTVTAFPFIWGTPVALALYDNPPFPLCPAYPTTDDSGIPNQNPIEYLEGLFLQCSPNLEVTDDGFGEIGKTWKPCTDISDCDPGTSQCYCPNSVFGEPCFNNSGECVCYPGIPERYNVATFNFSGDFLFQCSDLGYEAEGLVLWKTSYFPDLFLGWIKNAGITMKYITRTTASGGGLPYAAIFGIALFPPTTIYFVPLLTLKLVSSYYSPYIAMSIPYVERFQNRPLTDWFASTYLDYIRFDNHAAYPPFGTSQNDSLFCFLINLPSFLIIIGSIIVAALLIRVYGIFWLC